MGVGDGVRVGAVKLAHKMGLLWEKWGRIASLRGTTSPGRKLNGVGGASDFALCSPTLSTDPGLLQQRITGFGGLT